MITETVKNLSSLSQRCCVFYFEKVQTHNKLKISTFYFSFFKAFFVILKY